MLLKKIVVWMFAATLILSLASCSGGFVYRVHPYGYQYGYPYGYQYKYEYRVYPWQPYRYYRKPRPPHFKNQQQKHHGNRH